MQQAQALEFIEPLALDVLSLVKQEGGEDKTTRNFLTGLRRITDIIHKAQNLYKKQSAEALSQELSNLAGPSKEEVRLKADIAKWEKELATGTRTVVQ
jgi:hypothetical protein